MTDGARSARKPSYSVPALEKAFDLFEHLGDRPEGLTLSELAAGLGRSINELFRLVVVMERRGYLVREPGSDRYRVSYRLLDIGFRATPAQNLTQAAAPILHRLAIQSGQSCHLVVPAPARGIVVARHEPLGPTSFGVRLGAAVDLEHSCSGHVLLAFSDADRLATLLPDDAGRDATLSRLSDLLEAIRASGGEQRPSPMTYGVIDISRPVFGLDGRLVATLTVPFLQRVDGSNPVPLDHVADLVGDAAAAISAALGHIG